MENNKIELLGMSIDKEELFDIIFLGAVQMQIEEQNPLTLEDRRKWLLHRLELTKNILQRIERQR